MVSGLQRVTNSAFRSSTALLLLLLRLFFLGDSGFAMWNAEEGEEATSDIRSCGLWRGLQPSGVVTLNYAMWETEVLVLSTAP